MRSQVPSRVAAGCMGSQPTGQNAWLLRSATVFCPVPRDTPIVSGGVGVYTGPAPPGAGPYTFSGLVFNGEYAILKRNPNYGGSRPQRLDAIGLREGIDTEKAVGRVEGGGWDGVESDDPLLAPNGDLAHRLSTSNPPGAVRYRVFPAAVDLSRAYARRAGRSPTRCSGAPSQLRSTVRRSRLSGIRLRPTNYYRAQFGERERCDSRHQCTRSNAGASDTSSCGWECKPATSKRGSSSTSCTPHSSHSASTCGRRSSTISRPRIRDPTTDIRLAAMTTSVDYPDPASFLARMFEHDVPAAWQPNSMRGPVEHLASLAGPERERAAFALASRLATEDVPVIAYGTDTLGAVIGPRLGCGVRNGSTQGLDLAALCLKSQ